MTQGACVVYVTAPNHEEAMRLARAVVEERLAACANVLGAMTSVYWWNGQLTQDGEVALLLKTRTELADALTDRLRQLHPYDCPCVVALPVVGGNPDFLSWIATETKTPA